MGQIVFQATLGGQVAVAGPNTASSFTLTLPAATDTLVGKATTDTLTNKSISGSTNTLTNIANASLTNSNVTIGSTAISLGGTSTTLAGLTGITSSAITDSGLTSGRVTYAGASGLLSDSANLTFNGSALGVNGTTTIGNQASSGTSGSFAITGVGGAVYLQTGQNTSSASAAPLVFTNSGAANEWMRITSAGNVGIGTSSPNTLFSVAHVASAGTSIGIQHSSNNAQLLRMGWNDSTDYTFINTSNGSRPLVLQNTGGNVGIGTSSPDSFTTFPSKLVVGSGTGNQQITIYSGTTSEGNLIFADGTSGSQQYMGLLRYDHADNAMKFYTNGGTLGMTQDSSGNLGLGVTPNSSWSALWSAEQFGQAGSLFAYKSGSNYTVLSNNSYTVGGAYQSGDGRYINTGYSTAYIQNNSGEHQWLRAASGTAGNTISFTQAMTLDASGNLLVGTTTKETRGVTIYGSGANALYLKTTGTTNYWITNDGAGTGAGIIATIYNDTTIAGGISVLSNTTAYTSISDYRLKENVQPMASGLAKVSQLKPVTYTWKVDGASGQGFIAHELAEVVPECVVGEKDAIDEHGNIKPQSVDTSFLVATLTKAIQEQQALIESLTTRLTALENK